MRPGRVTLVSMAEAGWIWRGDESALVLVVGGRAGAVLTIYRANDGSPPPDIRVRHVQTSLQGRGEPRVVAGADFAGRAQAPAVAEADVAEEEAVPLTLLAHVSSVGDLNGAGGTWVGRTGAGHPVEGFTITPGDAIAKEDIEYQAILGNNWNTPWFPGAEFCGSRGLMLPLLGFRVRLLGDAAENFVCSYSGQFIGGKTSGPVADGEACEAGDAPLEALLVSIEPRTGVAASPATETASGSAADAAPLAMSEAWAAEPQGDIADPPAVASLRPGRRPAKPVKAAIPLRKR
jgi:hypothetical protein